MQSTPLQTTHTDESGQDNVLRTSICQPPGTFKDVFYFERSLDPYHPDAYPAKQTDSIFSRYLTFKSKSSKASEPRREGWMAIDYVENAVGFFPDGTIVETKGLFYLEHSSAGKNRLAAVPVDNYEFFQYRRQEKRQEKTEDAN